MSKVLLAGMLMRVIGSLIRYWVLYGVYDGGDAGRYYRYGLIYASFIWQLDFSFFNPSYWRFGHWWGTQATMFFSGFVTSLIGPTKTGAFLFFSVLSFLGLLLFIRSFQRNFPHADAKKYAAFVLLWPSLWFWPSSIGKDALILLATGLVVYGYTGKSPRIVWISMILGLAIAAAIRPHVAGVLIVSVAIAHWISPSTKWSFGHVLQGILVLIVLAYVLKTGLSRLGIEELDLENLKEYVDTVSVRTSEGGSTVIAPGLGIKGIPIAFVNILFRPFPWEAGSVLSAAASAEMIVFWGLVLLRRRRIIPLLMEWRQHRLLRFAIPLTLLYVFMLGMAVGNLGIIARQRVHVLPLLFIWLEATAPATKAALAPVRNRVGLVPASYS